MLEAVMNPHRSVELDIDIGADAKDWSAIQAAEKLKPVEMELRRVEEMVQEVVNEMDYLRIREQKLRDTNESTNERVKWFAFGTIGMLMALGGWQVVYLRAYFRYVMSCDAVVGDAVVGYTNNCKDQSISSDVLNTIHRLCTLYKSWKAINDAIFKTFLRKLIISAFKLRN
jgi:hypothetical protein